MKNKVLLWFAKAWKRKSQQYSHLNPNILSYGSRVCFYNPNFNVEEVYDLAIERKAKEYDKISNAQ